MIHCSGLSDVNASNVESITVVDGGSLPSIASEDRLWLISTRSITSQVWRANLETPPFSFSRVSTCGQLTGASMAEYLDMIATSPQVMIYVHGNRLSANEAIARAATVRSRINRSRTSSGIDWVIWSWPSTKSGFLTSDLREKASRCDAQGLYLGWLIRHHVNHHVPTSMIGYSFGGRILTGSLHAAAGGRLGGRQLSGEPVTGAQIRIGLVAPAIGSHWLSRCGNHRLAMQNIEEILLLYNRKDAILKRYWLLSHVRGESALGYTGPTSFARRVDGTKMPIHARRLCSHRRATPRRIGLLQGSVSRWSRDGKT